MHTCTSIEQSTRDRGQGLVFDDLESTAHACLKALDAKPRGLLTDIDGTISLIAPTPDAATVEDSARLALIDLADELDVVGTITGRAAENAEHMLSIPHLIYIGNHGLEHRRAGLTEIHTDAVFAVGAIAEALLVIREEVVQAGVAEGILFENKGVTGSVHYRLAPDQDLARSILLPIITKAASARGLRVVEGRMVIELRPAIAVNKGTALRSIVDRFDLRGLVFLGDDTTDIDAFNTLAVLRRDGRIAGVNIAVVAPESSPEVARAADVTVQGVAACSRLLSLLAERLPRRPYDA